MITNANEIKNKERTFEIISGMNKYKFKLLNKGNSLLITSNLQKGLTKFEYEGEFNLDYIKQVKLFTLYDSIDECLDEIFASIDTGNNKMAENTNNITLIVPLTNKEYKEIKFDLKIKEKKDKDKIEELYNIINQQQKEINEQKKEINEQKKEINEQKKEIHVQKKEINEQKKEINVLKRENNNLKERVISIENNMIDLLNFINEMKKKEKKKKLKIDSNIINGNKSYEKALKNWIDPNKGIKSELLYRLSTDGDSISTFHNKCDNISPTLLLAESLDGYKFGGFTTCTWDSKGSEKKDGNTFLFSFNKNQKYNKKYSQHNFRDIYSGDGYNGPYFGNDDLYFNGSMKKCYSWKGDEYSFLNDKDLANNKGDLIEVKEVEVYRLIFYP